MDGEHRSVRRREFGRGLTTPESLRNSPNTASTHRSSCSANGTQQTGSSDINARQGVPSTASTRQGIPNADARKGTNGASRAQQYGHNKIGSQRSRPVEFNKRPNDPNAWRSGIYTQQDSPRSFIFSRRALRRSPLGALLTFALCAALVIVTVLAGRAALQDTLLWQSGAVGGAGAAVQTASMNDAPQSTPKRKWAKGRMPYLYQKDEQWQAQRYAGSTIGESGCGPTCMSMVYVYHTGATSMDPGMMAQLAQNNSFVEDGKTSWRYMTQGAELLGLQSEEAAYEERAIRSLLEEGTPIICSMLPGDFTTTGHFIVLCGIDDDGGIIIRDPNSEENSRKSWELSRLMSQMANLWAVRA
ncbi:MAG: C39 family peptidase [Coriobacteriales bacterium]